MAAARLKREDYKRTKHDFHFSKWQVLIGPSDWEDYSQGKEGAARYRVHNLPSISAPGLYELGIGVSRSGLGRDMGKLDPDDIVVVYLGQADNVRNRLQSYGRSGAHLRNSYATGHWIDSTSDSPHQGPSLFKEVFSIGHAIVFRWAPMKDKRNAERTEAQLLDTFDYAWNKGSNGARRPGDIIRKINEIASSSYKFSRISRKLPFLRPSQVGIKIEAGKPLSPEECNTPGDENGKKFLHGIFKFSRWQPKLVSDKSSIDEDSVHICGIIMSDGIRCRQPPVPGRKRCIQHKGMRIFGLRTKSIADRNSQFELDMHMDSSTHNDQDQKTACGLNLGDGNFCTSQAVPGRKRCEEHKGMRTNSSVSKPTAEEKHHFPDIISVFSSSLDNINNNASSSNISSVDEKISLICGANLGNGSTCRRQPIRGNKRCWQHKGRRVDSTFSSSGSCSPMFDTLKCGVGLQNGSVCMRTPVQGRKRCEEHKGMRVNTSFS